MQLFLQLVTSLSVRGGWKCTQYGKHGGGGRIAIGIRLSDAQVASLARTGGMEGLARFDKTVDWLAAHPRVAIDLSDGEGTATGEHAGTFRVLDALSRATMLILR